MPTQLAPRLLSWASVLEDGTRQQAERAAAMPFVFPHLALMPDAHLGKGATVGSVIPTDHAIIPAAVGVDIGCGMIAVRTPFTADDLARGDLRSLPRGHRGRGPAVGGQVQPHPDRDGSSPRRRAGASGGGRLHDVRRQLAPPARHPRLGQPLHRGEPGRGAAGVAVPALRARAASATRSPCATSPSPPSCASSGGSPCRTPTSPTSSRGPTSSGRTCVTCGGPRSSLCSTARR